MALAGRNRSLVARTSKCGWAISSLKSNYITPPADG